MKINVNRNHFWTKIFFEQLASLGVQYACISPGSRSTPLTYSLSKNRKIKSFVHFDERSSAFFALGMAKATAKPVIIVTTSGTAVAELYPAIIEAYQQRTSLIICTADRPPELVGTGANQTINQHNIFKNHIRWFRDLGLPSVSKIGFQHLQKIAMNAYRISTIEDKGPVHLNFPFRKPLEPFSYTDKVDKKITRLSPQKFSRINSNVFLTKQKNNSTALRLINKIIDLERGIIIAGPMEYDRQAVKLIKDLSNKLKYPVFADGLSQLRFGSSDKTFSIISDFNFLFNSDRFLESHDPDIILQFGRTPTSSTLENFLEKTIAERYLINAFGDKFDPTRNASGIFAVNPNDFCEYLISALKNKKLSRNKSRWLNDFIKAEKISNNIKSRIIDKAKFPNEPSIISEFIKIVPSGSYLFIGNSLPVRDLDNFASKTLKRIVVHFNRGASGIDGITSTALGLSVHKKSAFLITGDLSFLHDLNALAAAVKYSIPLIIILINNNGGGIFESLPIANKIKHFEKYFIASHNLEISEIVKSLGINYQLVIKRKELHRCLKNNFNKNYTSIIEIQTDAFRSAQLRKKIFNEVKKQLDNEFPE